MFGYAGVLRSVSQGQGSFTMTPAGGGRAPRGAAGSPVGRLLGVRASGHVRHYASEPPGLGGRPRSSTSPRTCGRIDRVDVLLESRGRGGLPR
ncbi:MAG: hypothetical protein IPK80_03160 [Nannocystis sp.]|nr:hypothetical protein [Nannocystis sp.]